MVRPVRATTTTTTRLDTNILSGTTLDGEVPVATGFDSASTKSAGFAKAANIFYKILFTEKGSDLHNTNIGTEIPLLFSASIYDEEILFASVKRDVDDALSQVVSFQDSSGATADEKLVGASIVSFLFDREASSLNFEVELYNLAGETSVLEIPSIVIT